MLFNSLQFIVFFTVVLLLYRALPHRWQNRMLLAASYVFYGAWDWRCLGLILTTTLTDFTCGMQVHRSTDPWRRKLFVAVSMVVNLGILGFFKYANFFSNSLSELLALLGFSVHPLAMAIILPVGISFYTFQSMSYTIDVYRGDVTATNNFVDFALYVSFFTQLLAGPVEKAKHMLPQVASPRRIDAEGISEGVRLMLWGYFKKVLVADNMGLIADPIFSQSTGFTATQVLVGALAYAFQIYGDFSGYSDIARGAARLMGFEVMRNFDLPYFARNPQDFWRRWHISLSTWLRDYLYISLGGSRKGRFRTYVNLMATMLLGGLWHGAAWTFVIWGAYHGALLAAHRFWHDFRGQAATSAPSQRLGVTGLLQMGVMFTFTLYGWLIFRCKDFDQLREMTLALCQFHVDPSLVRSVLKILVYASVLGVIQIAQYTRRDHDVMRRLTPPLQSAFYLTLFYGILIFGVFESRSFIYFQF